MKELPMDAQTSPNPGIVLAPAGQTFAQPLQACTRDYGFDFDDEEIAREMLAPLPINLSAQATPAVNADEFEQVFQCFLS